MDLASHIRDVPNFPEPGILFRDITPLLSHAEALQHSLDRLTEPYHGVGVTKVVGIESRGFILAVSVATQLGTGFVPARKPGKLPWQVMREEYALEYGTDALEMHVDAIDGDDRVLIVDDVIATGGTAAASVRLVERMGGDVVGVAVLVELIDLGGRAVLGGTDLHALVSYGGD